MVFLDEAFCEAFAGDDHPDFGDVSGVIALKTDGGPEGKACHLLTIEDGRVVSLAEGKAKGADIELQAPFELAEALFGGAADPSIEFMRGKLKMSGDMELWLAVLPVWAEADRL